MNISAGPGDTQLALWEVGNCNDFSTFTEIAANDDSGPGLSALITDIALIPGQTYYIQLDAFGNTTPSGNITVNSVFAEATAPHHTQLPGFKFSFGCEWRCGIQSRRTYPKYELFGPDWASGSKRVGGAMCIREIICLL